jgi:acetyl-CoA carboxylase biotin carboxyl carrier protein
MTDPDYALDAMGRAASELVPQLTERLRRHRLGEIEVVDGDLRLRVRAAPAVEPASTADGASGARADASRTGRGGDDHGSAAVAVGSPAVGFFVYADGLGPGLEVGKGDALGHVEMLGVRHDVRAPRAGTVRNLVAESGEAVEYGQTVVELDAPERAR